MHERPLKSFKRQSKRLLQMLKILLSDATSWLLH
jgi:hypothetical protein